MRLMCNFARALNGAAEAKFSRSFYATLFSIYSFNAPLTRREFEKPNCDFVSAYQSRLAQVAARFLEEVSFP